ncbi:MAG: translation initiation factor IF-2, partial [Acidobacteria bacterium]|nr:translation initiation factor IF-2 [Acidobacteriota bacterium]
MRINELARELEVKAKAVLECLDELGVEEKKSHSSSIDSDLTEKVKAYFQQQKEAAAAPEPEAPVPPPSDEPVVEAKVAPSPSEAPTLREAPAETKAAPTAPARRPPAPSAGTTAPPRRPTPLRPPIRHPGEVKPTPPPVLEPQTPAAAPLASTPVVPAERPAARPAPVAARPAAAAYPSRPTIKAPTKPAPPLGPVKPGEPIYPRRPPQRTGGRPSRPAGAAPTGSIAVPPGGEPSRRGPHPVRGRTHPGAARPDRGRYEEKVRERPLRATTLSRPPAPPIVVDREITISEGITVKDLSEKLGVKARDLISRLLEKGVFATINQTLDPALAEEVAQSFGSRTRVVSYEEEALEQVEVSVDTGHLVPRAPVVTVMGHVDHGKTSLLDAIRETNVTEQEAGGITQHIGAYSVRTNGRRIVFLDTPGHEAFTRMRARGAKVTDVVVLVVAADDGVMPQTIEAINHARAAKVPMVVAINKIDKPGAQPDRVKKQLADHGLVPEEWGGDGVMVEVSAKQKKNLNLLMEMILLVADLQDLKANPSRPAIGTVLEAKLDKGRGAVCTVLVQNGTLHVGDSFLVGSVFGKVRAMLDNRGDPVEVAPPATPVEVLGLQSLPQAGDQFQVASDLTKAKQIALYRETKLRELSLARSSRLTLEQLHDQMKAGAVKELPIILKADVQGSLEVLADSLTKLGDERVKIKVIHSAVGAISVSDVLLASASNSIILGFNVRPERKAVELAQQEKVQIRLYTVIYDVMDEMKKAMVGLLEPIEREVAIGKGEVREVFRISKVGIVAGLQVSEGRLTRACSVRLLRDNVVVYEGRIASLRRFK